MLKCVERVRKAVWKHDLYSMCNVTANYSKCQRGTQYEPCRKRQRERRGREPELEALPWRTRLLNRLWDSCFKFVFRRNVRPMGLDLTTELARVLGVKEGDEMPHMWLCDHMISTFRRG